MSEWTNLVLLPALTTGCLYGLVATGFNLLEKSTRILNFAHGYLIMWGPMAALVLMLWGVPSWAAVVGGLLVTVAFGIVEERIAIRPFVGTSKALAWILSTLGASVILGQLAAAPFHAEPQAFPIGLSRLPIFIEGIRISPQKIVLFASAVVVYILLKLLYSRTRLGLMLSAVAEDFDGAQVLGISPSRMSLVSAALAAAVAALTGIVIAPLLLVSPSLGLLFTFTGFVAAALGGIGHLEGGMIGGLIVGFVAQLVTVYVGSGWTNVALFCMLLAVYLIRPWGIFGSRPVRAV